jgi:glycosyltransferase involved in cell wall biosynthesis
MKLSIFGRHPIPQGGFNGVMSLFEAIEFSRLGYETNLLLPFEDAAALSLFLEQHRLQALDDLPRFGGHFGIVPVFPDGENFAPCDVLVYQSYFPEDWEKFHAICRQQAKITTKNYPKFVPSADRLFQPSVIGQFKQFDLVACALREDVDLLSSHPEFASRFAGCFVYAPRGASPELLHPGYKAGLPPTIGLDVPNTPDMRALEHYFEPIEALRRDYPDLRVVSIGRDVPLRGATRIPFGRFDRIYEEFFNKIHLYCTINYEHSPSHLTASVQHEVPSWSRKAIYEVQNIECQMSGAPIIGHRDNIIAELYQPGRTGLNFTDFDDPAEIYRVLKYGLSNRFHLGESARAFAEANFSWSHCIGLWSDGIQALAAARARPACLPPAPAEAAPPPAPAEAAPPPEKSGASPEQARRQDLDLLIRVGQKFKWAKDEERSRLEQHGINLVRTDFYSETPTLADINSSFEYAGGSGLADTPAIFDDPAIFDADAIIAHTTSLMPYAASFDPPVDDAADGTFFWKNTQFSGTDAILLHSHVIRNRPATVIEIGSGYSSLVTHRAMAENGTGRLVCIDPEPRTDITNLPGVEFIRSPIQGVDIPALVEMLQPGDIVFYDGSHTVKTGSDAVFFYLKILPYLPSGVLVHAHDVRLPYPRNKKALTEAKLYWGEGYLLMAHLHNTARYRVLVGSEFLTRRAPQLVRHLMHGRYAGGGVSLWYEIK